MTRRTLSAAALAALLTVAFGAPAPAQVNRIVLRVNDQIATLYDYEQVKNEQLEALARAELSEERKQEIAARIGEETMRQLFEEMLLVSRAKQLGIAVPPSAVDEAMRTMMANFGVETVEQFAAGLEASGMTLERWREQMERNLVVREVMGREIQERVTLNEEDLRRYYRAHAEEFRRPRRARLREIVVLDDPDEDERARMALAEELAERIRASDDELDARLTGLELEGRTSGWIELGWVEASDLDPVLQSVVAELAAGEVGPPTRARGGIHVIQALEVEESRIEEFVAVRDRIDEKERDRLFTQEAEAYLKELIANSYIESRPPPEAAGFRPIADEPAAAGEASQGP